MVRHDGACRIYGEVGRDGDKDGASVSDETALNRMGDSIIEKGGYFSGIYMLTVSPFSCHSAFTAGFVCQAFGGGMDITLPLTGPVMLYRIHSKFSTNSGAG